MCANRGETWRTWWKYKNTNLWCSRVLNAWNLEMSAGASIAWHDRRILSSDKVQLVLSVLSIHERWWIYLVKLFFCINSVLSWIKYITGKFTCKIKSYDNSQAGAFVVCANFYQLAVQPINLDFVFNENMIFGFTWYDEYQWKIEQKSCEMFSIEVFSLPAVNIDCDLLILIRIPYYVLQTCHIRHYN